ncbi:hypothetical protein [Sphingomonas sp. Ant H11]|uniref:hypothetical protein n=1 Tax=Sphingomonas sp. Ant H11 TaxID=1564113 RepID=UPI000AFF5143|nr:hypothetical protein [Sphingomonas sp. Ant H11]
MISLPRPECPYCHEAMRRWPLGQHMLVCDTCRRPIVRYLAAPSRRIFRLRPLYSVINAIALFILVATFLAIVIARADIRHIMLAVAIPIAMFARAISAMAGCPGVPRSIEGGTTFARVARRG